MHPSAVSASQQQPFRRERIPMKLSRLITTSAVALDSHPAGSDVHGSYSSVSARAGRSWRGGGVSAALALCLALMLCVASVPAQLISGPPELLSVGWAGDAPIAGDTEVSLRVYASNVSVGSVLTPELLTGRASELVLLPSDPGPGIPLTPPIVESGLRQLIADGKAQSVAATASQADSINEFLVQATLDTPLAADQLLWVRLKLRRAGDDIEATPQEYVFRLDMKAPEIFGMESAMVALGPEAYLAVTLQVESSSDTRWVSIETIGYTSAALKEQVGIAGLTTPFLPLRKAAMYALVSGQDEFALTLPCGRDSEIPTDAIFVVRGRVADESGNSREFEEIYPVVDIRREANLIEMNAEPTSFTLSGFGDTQRLHVVGTIEGGARVELSAGATGTQYSASPTGIVSVTADGIVTALSNGTATVRISNRGLGASVRVEVRDVIPPTALRLDPLSVVLDRKSVV